MEPEYNTLVSNLVKPGVDILHSLKPEDCHNLHMAVGIAGEAGELIDAVKKHVIYRKPLDIDNIIEELGDLEFYMQGLRSSLGITREECLSRNFAKLCKRFPSRTYKNVDAIVRADKPEGH